MIRQKSKSVDEQHRQDSDIFQSPPRSNDSEGESHEDHDAENLAMARKDIKLIFRSKALFLVVIFICAVTFATLTYFLTRSFEKSSFEAQFQDFGNEIDLLSNGVEESMIFGISAFVNSWTSLALDTGSVWPQFTVPHFERRGLECNNLALTVHLTMVPLVNRTMKTQWEKYSQASQGWIQEGVQLSSNLNKTFLGSHSIVPSISPVLYRFSNNNGTGARVPQDGPGLSFGPGNYGPVWQQVPAPLDSSIINYDILSHPTFARVYQGMLEENVVVVSEVMDLTFLYKGSDIDVNSSLPESFMLYPIYSSLDESMKNSNNIVGFAVSVLRWETYLQSLIARGVNEAILVVGNSCGQNFTFVLKATQVSYLGPGDLHDKRYDYLGNSSEFAPFLNHSHTFNKHDKHCLYELYIFPTEASEKSYESARPYYSAAFVFFVFCFTVGAFLVYDYMVQRHQRRVEAEAKRKNAIVSSLFPSNVRHRLLRDVGEEAENETMISKFRFRPAKAELKTFLDKEKRDDFAQGTKPIADLFPNCTVMFADIVGFTAWSSTRQPSQVFTLLETLYRAFDQVAKRKRVFKVETIGDCYVAVAGLPEAREDHAIVMAKFARDCRSRMNHLTRQLEVQLGPGTGDLSTRIGLHSGPVTAGVLRGEKSRFQLFGATVNNAERIETGGERNRIHLSSETAELLMAAGKGHWVAKREDFVHIKGKGTVQTYWLLTKFDAHSDDSENGAEQDEENDAGFEKAVISEKVEVKVQHNLAQPAVVDDAKVQRLVNWNVDVLGRLMRMIVARRGAIENTNNNHITSICMKAATMSDFNVIDEVREIISLPGFDKNAGKRGMEVDTVQLDEKAQEQLRNFVCKIAAMYRDNAFHNFEHASHVTMSVVKLLSRIVAPDIFVKGLAGGDVESTLHDHTYGITSDPLTQFACVFAALIHDADHSGVPNTQLVKEGNKLAKIYRNKSVAEQHSVNLAWDLLMDEAFTEMREIICTTQEEVLRFRQLVVNSVMATDIMDKDLKALRNARWDKAFSEDKCNETETEINKVNRKATIVIEHLIQASDVAHTMQHWHIYRKWNERLFQEMYEAFRKGRAEKDPCEFWYQGEIGFFDFYVIPLAKKLKDCGVFGVSSDEYLNYAQKNRREWELKGQEVVESMKEKFHVINSDCVKVEETNGIHATLLSQ